MRRLGRYRLDTVEGSGAFATVWRGFDTDLQVTVAVKVLAENWTHHADVRERFLDEARFLRQVRDDRVVRVHDVGVHEGQPYFVMDHYAGGTLADRADGRLEPTAALALVGQAARAVGALHAAGVVHRDVKPSNFLIDSRADGTEHVIVADLGSAKRLAEASGITVTTGTPAYMAPEQALGQGIDERTDVYALGVLTFVMLTGTLPFESGTAALMARGRSERPARTASRRAVPAPLAAAVDGVVARATSYDAGGRPASTDALAAELEHLASGGRAAAVSSGFWAAVGIAVLAVVLFGAAAVATLLLLR